MKHKDKISSYENTPAVTPLGFFFAPNHLSRASRSICPFGKLRVMVRYSNHETLEGEAPLGLSSGRRLKRQVERQNGRCNSGG